ncbi:MAG: hypothetical protein NT096_12310 [Proteobacteria bacterium]|nr:hypothetical protein [Pseudomonadota bacterium]
MNYRDYMKRIQEKLGESKAPDRIQEAPWLDIVIKELNDISKDCATELQREINCCWNKGSYCLDLHEAPPTRLLALEIALASWLGWIMHEKHGDGDQLFSSKDCWVRIEEAYLYGVKLSKENQRP